MKFNYLPAFFLFVFSLIVTQILISGLGFSLAWSQSPLPATISSNISAPVANLSFDTYGPAPANYRDLLKENAEIRDNDLLNEQLLDLVEANLTDSIIVKRAERHHVFAGGILRMLGFKWMPINFRKEKYIGTAITDIRLPGDPLFTEYDVNWNIAPHLPAYKTLAYEGYQRQAELGRKKKKFNNYEGPPFVKPEPDADMATYLLHCELTPPEDYRDMLDQLFYPCRRGTRLLEHPNWGIEYPSIGMYGAFCSDCNHNCHSEIHPYEWLWWLNLNPTNDGDSHTRTWVIGMFQEGSNRFPHWSPSPRIGEISIPIAFPADKMELTIGMEHLVFSGFVAEGLQQWSVPENAADLNFREKDIHIQAENGKSYLLKFRTNTILSNGGTSLWLSDLNLDEAGNLVTGKLHLALSIKELFTTRIKMQW